jgi:hypothetical protein
MIGTTHISSGDDWGPLDHFLKLGLRFRKTFFGGLLKEKGPKVPKGPPNWLGEGSDATHTALHFCQIRSAKLERLPGESGKQNGKKAAKNARCGVLCKLRVGGAS